MILEVRPATAEDASAMMALLNEIIAAGGTTAHRKPFDEQAIIAQFIASRLFLCCLVAVSEGKIAGFQALEWADPDWPGDDALPADWAIIATYVNRAAHGRGVGRALFARTSRAAAAAGVRFIDATIRLENSGGRRFYERLGFVDYRHGVETISKRFSPIRAPAHG